MSVFNKKNTNKKNKKSSFAFVEDKSIDSSEAMLKSIEKFTKAGRGAIKHIPNPNGRPKIKDEEKQSEVVLIYLTKEQKDNLVSKAKKCGLSVSKYISLKLFGTE